MGLSVDLAALDEDDCARRCCDDPECTVWQFTPAATQARFAFEPLSTHKGFCIVKPTTQSTRVLKRVHVRVLSCAYVCTYSCLHSHSYSHSHLSPRR